MRPLAALVAGLLTLVSVAQAQENTPFAQGTWALQLVPSYIDANDASEDVKAGTLALGAGYHLLDNLGLYGEVVGYAWDQDRFVDTDAVGGGLNLLLRWHFLNFDRFTIYADGGAGIVELDDDFPAGGTRFNFTPRVGLGATVRLADSFHLLGGVRYFHMSNANTHGRDENPGIDALEYYVGAMFTF